MPAPIVVAAGLAGGASLANQLISSAFNASQADKNRDWQERMSNTSHVREVADLRAAGLNPVLSARYGGASTPGGASAQAAHGDVGAAALQGVLAQKNVALVDAQTRDLNSAAALKDAQAKDLGGTFDARLENLRAELGDILERTDLTVAQRNMVASQMDKVDAEIRKINLESTHSAYGLAKSRAESYHASSAMGKADPFIRQVMDVIDKLPFPRIRIGGPKPKPRGRWNRDGEWEGGD